MKLGLALCGGGIRGIAHAGILKAFEENDIVPYCVSGTSAGSYVAILYSIGYTALEIYKLFKTYANELIGKSINEIVFDQFIFNQKIKLDGFRSGETIEKLFNEMALKKGYKNISDIKIPIAICSTNLKTEKECVFIVNEIKRSKNKEYVNSSKIGLAARASSSLAIVFDPCFFEDKILMDGGTLNNVPVDEARNLGADFVVGINFEGNPINKLSNMVDIGMKTLDMMGNKISEFNILDADLQITVDTDGAGLLDIEKLDYCYDSGYRKGLELVKILKKENI